MTKNNFIQNKLKYIFSKHILPNFWDLYNKNFKYLPNSRIQYMKLSIDKFLNCRNTKHGFVSYKCPSCKKIHKFSLTCKSRLCPCCGFAYSQKWTSNFLKHILNINHRHVLFTISKQCRPFFFYDRNLLTKLSSAVNDIFKYLFHNIYDKNKRVNKISKYSPNYFTNSDIVHYGLITVIHTFERDLKWNPHIHAIVSLGGFNKNFHFKKFNYFNTESIAGRWKYHVLNIIANGNYSNENIKLMAKNTVSELYNKNTRFFFNIADGDINNSKGIIKYLGRYLARSPIAEYKITNITDDEVTFFFNDLMNNKEKTYVSLNIHDFIQKVLIHLPPKNFKTVNRFGFYARKISNKLKNTIQKYKKNNIFYSYSFF